MHGVICHGVQALMTVMKKWAAQGGRATGALPGRTGAAIMRQTVTSLCNPMTWLKKMMMVQLMRTLIFATCVHLSLQAAALAYVATLPGSSSPSLVMLMSSPALSFSSSQRSGHV